MTTFTNRKEVYEYAQDLAKEILADHENYGDDLYDLIATAANNSEHVIYHGKAQALLGVVWSEDIDAADRAIQETGGYDPEYNFWAIQSVVAYYVLQNLIEEAVMERRDRSYF